MNFDLLLKNAPVAASAVVTKSKGLAAPPLVTPAACCTTSGVRHASTRASR